MHGSDPATENDPARGRRSTGRRTIRINGPEDVGMQPMEQRRCGALASRITSELRERAVVVVVSDQRAIESPDEAGLEAANPELPVRVVPLSKGGRVDADAEALRTPDRHVPAVEVQEDVLGAVLK